MSVSSFLPSPGDKIGEGGGAREDEQRTFAGALASGASARAAATAGATGT